MKSPIPQKKKPVYVLAVDDKPANLIALEAVLGRDYSMVLANSGAEALTVLEQRKDIALILMDLQMPDMDGFETAVRVKQMEDCEDIPIIFITAIYKEDPYIKKGYEAGGIDYFSKPFDPEILKLKVGVYATYRERELVLKERERQLRESEELLNAGRKLASILESVPVGVIIADNQGRICQTNDAVSRIWKSAEPIETDRYGEILGWWNESGQMLKDKDGPLALALRMGKSSHNELIQVRCLDGTDKSILGCASPLRGLDGEIMGAVVIIQDVTEPKKIEEALEQRITRLVSLGVELEQSTGQTRPH